MKDGIDYSSASHTVGRLRSLVEKLQRAADIYCNKRIVIDRPDEGEDIFTEISANLETECSSVIQF